MKIVKIIYVLGLGLSMIGCSHVVHQPAEPHCADCHSKTVVKEVQDCHKPVKVIKQAIACSHCTFPVSVRADAQPCHFQ